MGLPTSIPGETLLLPLFKQRMSFLNKTVLYGSETKTLQSKGGHESVTSVPSRMAPRLERQETPVRQGHYIHTFPEPTGGPEVHGPVRLAPGVKPR